MLCKSKIHFVAAMIASTALAVGCRSGSGRFARNDSPGGFAKAGCPSGGCCARPSPASSGSPSYSTTSTLQPSQGSTASFRAQRTCPVTGEELGSMGKPISVTVRGETIFVCCQGCVKKVQQNPDKYLAKVHAESGAGS